jgi:anti-sigma factor RsiW
MSPRSNCPDPPLLAQPTLGRLSGTEAEALERHLAVCPRCLTTVEALPAEDELVRALRPQLGPEESPRLDLARGVIPALKRLRPKDATVAPP